MAKPNLRFKEFTADWHNIKLGSFITERNHICDDSDIPLYSLTIEQGITPKTERYTRDFLVKDDSNAYKTVFPNDFAMNPMNLRLGAISYNQENKQVKLSKYYNVFYVDTSKVDRSFFCSYATCEKAIALYNLMATGSLVEKRRNHFKDFVEYEMPFPNINEQTKIASFLSTVDTKIAQLSQKHQLLSQYKQGMMQKLFSQQIRFKADDGSEFEEWEYKPLHEIANKNSIKNKDGSVTEVLTNSALQGIIKQSDYFDREIVTESNLSGYYLVNINDFIYNPRISVHAPVGPIKRNKKCLGVMSPLYTIFTVEIGNLTYLEYFFDSNFWHDYVKSVANSGARHDRMNITNKDFFEMPILYPCLEEQTKIANFLSTIDQKIEVTAQQIEQAKQWKKGLLQQMFV